MICLAFGNIGLQAVRQLLMFAMSLQILQAAAHFECNLEQHRHAHNESNFIYVIITDMLVASRCRSVNLERIEQQNGKQVSNELCERDPQLPQGFAPIKDNILIRPGDTLKATCMFDSSAVHSPVNAGATHNDEMCNLYLMLYSQLPFFMACYGSPQVDRHGMGGIPPAGRVEVLSACLCLPPCVRVALVLALSCESGTYACPLV